jgi:hypothetical protein
VRTIQDVIVKPNENPDFLTRHFSNSPYFGVEVTEYYANESNARLDRVSGYTEQLLDGAAFKHKDDAKHLNVAKVDIVRSDGSTHAKDIPAIIQEMPQPTACAIGIADRIVAKSKRIAASTAEMSHANLIIDDKTGSLRLLPTKEFHRAYFVTELVNAVTSSMFREIYFVTTLGGELVYVPLKMLHMLAEAYLFNGLLVQTGFDEKMPTDVHETELFAAYLNDITEAPVVVRHDSSGVEVIFGDAGLLIENDKSVKIRLHSDFPIPPDSVEPGVNWRSVLGADFDDKMKEFRRSNSFSTEAVFAVAKGPSE